MAAERTGAPPEHRAPATDAAAALLRAFVRRGIRHIVLSPGSRSQALALAAADLEHLGVALHVRIDERVAGFTALGIGRESGLPALVICTSGTAVANLLPAVLEAHHAGVPLVLLTADRPPELRGIGANQTTHQPGMFAHSVRFEADAPVPEDVDPDGDGAQSRLFADLADRALDAALGIGLRPAGPVHLNLPLREPLAGRIPAWFAAGAGDGVQGGGDGGGGAGGGGDGGESAADLAAVSEADDEAVFGAVYQGGGGIGAAEDAGAAGDEAPRFMLRQGPRTVVVAGADAGPDAERIARLGGWPLIAEIVSGARFGRGVVHGYRALLRDPELGGRIERVLVWGHPTLSREVTALLSRADVEVVAVRGPGEPLNLNGQTRQVETLAIAEGAHAAGTGRDDVTGPADPAAREWFAAWMRASRAHVVDLSPAPPDAEGLAAADPGARLGAVAAELAVIRTPLDRALLVDAVWRASWPHDRLVFGSSRLVRVADQVLGGKRVPVHANRGLAGIDGTVSTAIGVALASQRGDAGGTTRVVLGDLALLHDVGALLLPAAERAPRVQLVVGNDGGGTIFDGLEVAATAGPEAMDRVQYTPQRVLLEHLALAYGWGYVRATTRAELDRALTAPAATPVLIEVPLER